MADNEELLTPTSGDEPTEGVSVAKRPTGKSRRAKTTDDAPDESPADAAVSPSWTSPASTNTGKQITINISVLWRVLAALGVAIVAGLAVLFAVLWYMASFGDNGAKSKLDSADDAKQASDYFVTQLLNSMNTTSAGEYVDTMSPLTTGQFRDNLVTERDKTQADITQMQLKITPKIWSSGVVSNTTDSATTLVVAEISGTSSVATQPVTNVGMFRLTMEKHDGKWLVSQMDPGPSSSGIGSGANPVDPNAGAPPAPPAPAPAPAG